MRVGKGCERCRYRHIRCVIPPGALSCASCERQGRVCQLDPPFHFKTVHRVYQKSNGTSARFDLEWDEDQVWIDTSQPVTFVLEGWDNVEGEGPGEQLVPENPTVTTRRPLSPDFPWEPHRDGLPDSLDVENATPQPAQSLFSELAPQQQIARSYAISPPTMGGPPALSLREASLMRHFIQRIAPWADVCDPQCHFSTEVPRRALQVPMLLKAVMALAARHDAILNNQSDWEASAYHGHCLELLIPALDWPEQTYDENLLVTVVLLRIYEELENTTDPQFHLLGSNRLINLMSRSASSGGLAEAVSWQFLRQAIYASVVQYQPLQLDLQNYEQSSMFQRTDDAAFANRVIFHCADILRICRNVPQEPVDEDARLQVVHAVDEWHRVKPTSWQPLRYQPADATVNRPFPEIWMMSAPVVVGMQYYHAACIFLTFSEGCSRPMSDYQMARSRRMSERTIASHIVSVIGLSQSNESVQNAYFMACHLLHRFGYCLKNRAEQQGSMEFLSRVEEVMGWRTSWIKRELERQWAELSQVDSPDG
ncbi:Zn(II)2Cys6 transcription factor [Penicillium brasilianum]|uniref:Zn(II)2Cys6 transcription factor n=1 Tax=Penicillium brasilianum TaxID=104259 RepID=A0A1S9RRQ8_PENBI|nr:Zn(II)2Cys6 transcription factor [Penicillium brasilianum]